MSDNGDRRLSAVTESAAERVEDTAERAESGVEDLVRAVTDAHIFERHEVEGRTVITASTIRFGGGFGFGGGGGEAEPQDNTGWGTGAGGGSQGEGRPVAVIEVAGGEVRIRPVVDWTKLGALVLTSLVTVWAAMRKGRKARAR
jgi:uncharacterized spore protein YtfJ